MKPTRREVLLGLVGFVFCGVGGLGSQAYPRDEVAESLLAIFPRRESARAIGRAFLRENPAEGCSKRLVEKIVADRPTPDLADRKAVGNFVRDRIRSDFERSRTVELDGWVLALSEVRLCALAACVA